VCGCSIVPALSYAAQAMELLADAPEAVLLVALSGLVLGALPLLWIATRMLRFVARREQRYVGPTRYFFALSTSALMLGIGIGASGLAAALHGYRAFTAKTHVAEVQCIELAPSKLRLYYAEIGDDGRPREAETYDLDGDQWTVAGEVLRFRPFLTPLGVSTVHKVTRVEGRWISAADANARKPTAYDRDGGASPAWLAMLRHGTRGPLGWLIEGVHGQAVSQLPDRRAVYDLYITPNGYVLDKRSL
jgi:hypothetical protein